MSESDQKISQLRERLLPSTGNFFNDVDVVAVQNAVPYLNLSTAQARDLIIVVEHQIAERAKHHFQRESLLITSALVEKLGGRVTLSEKELQEQDISTLSRIDDPLSKTVMLRTN